MPGRDVLADNDHPPSKLREVRIKLERWSGDAALVILHYRFLNANPPGACPAETRVFKLEKAAQGWRVTGSYDFASQHEGGFWGSDLIDLNGDGQPEWLVQNRSGGAGVALTEMAIFDVQGPGLRHLLTTVTDWDGMERYRLDIDIAATQKTKAQKFCFVKIQTHGEDSFTLPTPVVRHPCYPRTAK